MTAGADRLAHRRDRRLSVDHGPGDRLTDRQHEVLRRLALGHKLDRIAADLQISRTTVQNHRQNALNAYGGGCTFDLFRAVGWLVVPEARA